MSLSLQQVSISFFGKAWEESRLAYVSVMAVSPQQLHLGFYELKGQLQRWEKSLWAPGPTPIHHSLQDTKKPEYGALSHFILWDMESQSIFKSRYLRKRFQLKSTNEWAPAKIKSQHCLSAVCQGLCCTLELFAMHRWHNKTATKLIMPFPNFYQSRSHLHWYYGM